jgi:hypothetical protein
MMSQARFVNGKKIITDLVKMDSGFGHYMARYAGTSEWHEIEEICK